MHEYKHMAEIRQAAEKVKRGRQQHRRFVLSRRRDTRTPFLQNLDTQQQGGCSADEDRHLLDHKVADAIPTRVTKFSREGIIKRLGIGWPNNIERDFSWEQGELRAAA